MPFKTILKIVAVLCLFAVLSIQCIIIFLPDISRQVGLSMIGPLSGDQPFDFTVSRLGVNYTQISDLSYGEDLALDTVRFTYRIDSQNIIRVEKIVISGLNAVLHLDANNHVRVSGFEFPQNEEQDDTGPGFDISALEPYFAYLPEQIILKNSTVLIDNQEKRLTIPVQGDVRFDHDSLQANIKLSITPMDQKISFESTLDLETGPGQMKIWADTIDPGILLSMAQGVDLARDLFCRPLGFIVETKDFSKFDFKFRNLGLTPDSGGEINLPEVSGVFSCDEKGMGVDAGGIIEINRPGIVLNPFIFKISSRFASTAQTRFSFALENETAKAWTFEPRQMGLPLSTTSFADQVQLSQPLFKLVVSGGLGQQTAQLTLGGTGLKSFVKSDNEQAVVLDMSKVQVKSEFNGNLFTPGASSHLTFDTLIDNIAFHHNEMELNTGVLNVTSTAEFRVANSSFILDHAHARIKNRSVRFDQGEIRARIPELTIESVVKKSAETADILVDVNAACKNAKFVSNVATAFIPKAGITGRIKNPTSPGISFKLKPWLAGTDITMNDKSIRAKGVFFDMPFTFPFKSKPSAGRAGAQKVVVYDKVSAGVAAKIVQTSDDAVEITGNVVNPGLPGLAVSFSARAGLDDSMQPFAKGRVATNQVTIVKDALVRFVPELSAIDELEFDLEAFADFSWADQKINSFADISITNGTLAFNDSGFSATGICSDIHFNDLMVPETIPGQYIYIDTLKAGRFDLNDAKLRFSIEDGKTVNIENLKFNWCNGIVSTEAFRLPSDDNIIDLTLYCDRLEMETLFHQLGVFDAEGGGTLSGRIPVTMKNTEISFDNGFLFSTPGEGGRIYIKGLDGVLAGIPTDTPEFSQLELAQEALKNFEYKWVKLKLNTHEDTLLVNMQLDGKPASVLPFEYRRDLNSFVRVDAQSPGSNFQGIALDVNLTLPFNQVLQFGNNLKSIMNP